MRLIFLLHVGMKFLFRNCAKLATFFVKAGDKLKFRVVDFAAAKDRQLLKNARFRPAERADVFVSNVAFHIHLQIFGLVQFNEFVATLMVNRGVTYAREIPSKTRTIWNPETKPA